MRVVGGTDLIDVRADARVEPHRLSQGQRRQPFDSHAWSLQRIVAGARVGDRDGCDTAFTIERGNSRGLPAIGLRGPLDKHLGGNEVAVSPASRPAMRESLRRGIATPSANDREPRDATSARHLQHPELGRATGTGSTIEIHEIIDRIAASTATRRNGHRLD